MSSRHISPPDSCGIVRSTQVRRVIEVVFKSGEGTEPDPVREIVQWWSMEGALLAERDTWKEGEQRTVRAGGDHV